MKGSSIFTAFVLAASLASPLVMAADAEHKNTEYRENIATRQYVGGAVSYVDVDNARKIDDKGEGYSVFYGRQLSDHFWWETEGGFYKIDGEVPDHQDFFQYHLTTGLSYAFGDRTGFTPYLIVALGAIKHEVVPTRDNDTNFTANAGIGAVTGPIFDNGLKLRGDVRYVYDDFDGAGPARGNGAFGDVRASLGLEFPLGYTKVVTNEKVVMKTREVMVNKPMIDSDGDGVPDDLDECPNTMPGGKVDSKGCLIVNQTITFNDILFELNSATLTHASENTLRRIAESLKSQTDFRIEVAGHTDSTGTAAYNDVLSQKRADSVRRFLTAQGVDSDRVSARGYGEMEPVASNESVSGRAMNRRVEFRVTEK